MTAYLSLRPGERWLRLDIRSQPVIQSAPMLRLGPAMTIEEFWNRAFLAALARLAPDDAKLDADLATDLCIKHWSENIRHFAPDHLVKWQEQDISNIRQARFVNLDKPAI